MSNSTVTLKLIAISACVTLLLGTPAVPCARGILVGSQLFAETVDFGVSSAVNREAAAKYSLQNPQSITANYTYLVTPTGINAGITVHLLQSFPYLNVTKTLVFTNPRRVYTIRESLDELGNLRMTLMFQSPIGGNFTVTIMQYATVYSIKFNVDPTQIGDYDKASQLYRAYTSSTKYIESDHPEIVSASKEIVGNERNPYLMAQKIFRFVVHHVKRDWSLAMFNPDTEGALFALRARRGVCRHFSALFTALARASGIPTAMIWGSWGIGDVDKHNWVHFYLPNYGWIPVETTAGDSVQNVNRWFAQIPDNTHIPVLSVNYIYRVAQGHECKLQSLVPREAPFISKGPRAPPTARYEHASLLDSVSMQRRMLRVTVEYEVQDQKCAWHVSDLAHRSLPRIEELVGFPYPFNFDITIYIQKGENNYNLYEKGIYLIPKTWDFAVIHELAHYWTAIYGIGGGVGKRWLQEAFATLLPVLIFEGWGEVAKNLEVRNVHLRWFHQYYGKYEQPLDVWKGEDVKEIHDFLYGKTYCFIYILYREFGIEALREVNRRIYESGRVANSIVFKETLERVSTAGRLDDVFSGWVFGSSYLKYAPEDFSLSRIPLMTLNLSKRSTKVGEKVTLTARLIDIDGRPVANQTINFYVNSTLLGSILTDFAGIATFGFNARVDPGAYQITAHYAGSLLFPSKETAELTVTPVGTSLSLDAPSALPIMKLVSLNATLKDEFGSPIEGTNIDFYINVAGAWTKIGSAQTNSQGFASIKYAFTKAGVFPLRVTYSGAVKYGRSESVATISVTLMEEALPYLVAIGVVVAGAVAFMLAKRRLKKTELKAA